MTPAADFFRALPVSGKGFALLGSVSVHVAVALAVVRGAPHAARNANTPAESVVEVSALELSPAETPEPVIPASASAGHHHDYAVPPDHDATPHDPSIRHIAPMRHALNLPATAMPNVMDSPAPNPEPAPAARRFVMTIARASGVPGGITAASGLADAPGGSVSAAPVPEASVDTPAKLLAGSSPSYTPEAEAAGVEADVPLEIVVDSAGSVSGARALSHVGYGLDEAALGSVRGYRFAPAQRAGKTVAVRMRWLMRFQLR